MNNSVANGATNRPVTTDNEATPDASVFAAANPATTTTAFSYTIYDDDHLIPLGGKLDTEIFLKGNIKNMDDKDTIDTTLAPDTDTTNTDTP